LLDDFTTALLSNAAVLEMNSHAVHSRQVAVTDASAVWAADGAGGEVYVALFNRASSATQLTASFASLGLSSSGQCSSRDLWTGATAIQTGGSVSVDVRAHGVALLLLTKCAPPAGAVETAGAVESA
jgi:hypothetical protein